MEGWGDKRRWGGWVQIAQKARECTFPHRHTHTSAQNTFACRRQSCDWRRGKKWRGRGGGEGEGEEEEEEEEEGWREW